jgi:hypothetical protein
MALGNGSMKRRHPTYKSALLSQSIRYTYLMAQLSHFRYGAQCLIYDAFIASFVLRSQICYASLVWNQKI